MAPERCRVTGGQRAKDLPVMDRQTMRLGKIRQRGAHDFAQSEGGRLTGSRVASHRTGGTRVRRSTGHR